MKQPVPVAAMQILRMSQWISCHENTTNKPRRTMHHPSFRETIAYRTYRLNVFMKVIHVHVSMYNLTPAPTIFVDNCIYILSLLRFYRLPFTCQKYAWGRRQYSKIDRYSDILHVLCILHSYSYFAGRTWFGAVWVNFSVKWRHLWYFSSSCRLRITFTFIT